MCVSGCTGSGKSEWVLRFLANAAHMVVPPPRAILYCYGELNNNVLRLQQMQGRQHLATANEHAADNKEKVDHGGERASWHLHVHNGVPDESHVQHLARTCGGRLLLVLDDLMVGMGGPFLDVLFTRGSHNWGCSVVLVTQHLFASRELRVARANSHYLVLMRNPSGALQVRTLAQQLFPGARAYRYFMDAYGDATRERFSYLLVDMHPQTPDAYRLKTHIYPGELCTLYMPKEGGSSSSTTTNSKQ